MGHALNVPFLLCGLGSQVATAMGTIRQYIAWTEKRIARLVIKEGLHVGLIKVTQGPLTITFQVRLLQPSRVAINKFLHLGDAIAEAIQAEAVRVVRVAGAFAIEIPSPLPRTPSSADLLRHSQGIQVCVGLDSLRRPVYIDLRQHGAMLWVGPSRRGKTQSIKCTLYCLARQKGSRLKYVILCHERKRDDWGAFARAVGCMGIVTTPAEHQAVLQWATTTLLKMNTPFTFVIVVDDLLNLLTEAPQMAIQLAQLASLGAGLGIHLLAGTQEAGSKRGTGGEGVEANASAKILYKTTSKARAARNAGQGQVDLMALTGVKGDAVLLVDGVATRIATGYTDDRDILQLPTGPQYQTPWREQSGSTPPRSTHSNGSTAPSTGSSTHTGVVRGGATSGTNDILGRTPLPDPPVDNVATGADVDTGTPITAEAITQHPLPNRAPDAAERAYLRALYRQSGSKNQVLKIAWGGVVNLDGKTPKTWKWLQETLTETETVHANGVQSKPENGWAASAGKVYLDLNTPEGRAAVDQLITQDLLPRDEITEVVCYHQEER